MSLVKRPKRRGLETRWREGQWQDLWRSVPPIGLWVKGGELVGYGDWMAGEVLWRGKLDGGETYWPDAVWSRTDKRALPIGKARLMLWTWQTADAEKVDRALTRTLVRWMDQKIGTNKTLADWAWRHGESEPLRLQGLTVLGALLASGPSEKWFPRQSFVTQQKGIWLAKLLQGEAWAETWGEG